MMSWLRPHWKVGGGRVFQAGRWYRGRASWFTEMHRGEAHREKHKGLGSQIGEVGKRKRAGEAGSKGGKQHRAGHKGLVRPLGQGAGRQTDPLSATFWALSLMLRVAQGHGHTKTGWPQTSSLLRRVTAPPGLARTYLKHWRW